MLTQRQGRSKSILLDLLLFRKQLVTLMDTSLTELQILGLNTNDSCGQAYDSAVNMAGANSDVRMNISHQSKSFLYRMLLSQL
jgi:hypothetical protein